MFSSSERQLIPKYASAFCGQNRIVRFFVDDIVRVDVIVRFLVIQLLDDELLHGAHQAVGALVQVADLLARARNDQRRSRLIDEDGVHLVHNRERVPALNHLLFVNDHVIPQIVEAELVVCSVGDIRRVCRVLFRVRLPMHDQTRGQPHELVNAPHLFSADAREVVVDRNDVNSLARQRVEVRGQGCNQRFAFTCFHFGNSALMQDDAAHDLHTERALSENAVIRFPHRRKRVGQKLVERFPRRIARLELFGHAAQLVVAHGGIGIRQCVHAICDDIDLLQLMLAVSSEQLGYKRHNRSFPHPRVPTEY